MAKINKVELNLGQKIANPFKTTRKSDTNPFKYSNFEGNTLQFADVFEGFEPQKISKMKLITSSVIGSITKLRNSITEPIVNFVNRVREGITSAWTYAKNTEVKIAGLDNLSEGIHNALNYDVGKGIINALNYDIGKGISDSMSAIGKNITDSISFLNKDVTELNLGLSDKWTSLINRINLKNIGHNKISSDMSVAELRQLWEKEIELTGAKEIAIDSTNKMEARVA